MERRHLTWFVSIALASLAPPQIAQSQIHEVVVGVTPTCPYGLTGCWGGAAEGLTRLTNVESVAKAPDAYNSTASVYLKNRETLPDFEQWTKDFKTSANEAYGFRGVELTVEGTVSDRDNVLILRLADGKSQLSLLPLKHKLQWNFKKGVPRQPEPDEAAAFESLRDAVAKAGETRSRVMVTGPLIKQKGSSSLEVREFFLVKD